MKKQAFNYLLTAVLIVITIWIILSSINISEVPRLLKQTNVYYLFLAALCMVGYWLTDSLIIMITLQMVNIKYNFFKSLKLTMIGQYYTAITPLAIGCQPAQIYNMVNDDVPLGKATSVVINKFIIYQIAQSLYSVVVIIFNYKLVYNVTNVLFAFTVFAFFVDSLSTVAFVFLVFNPGLISKFIYFLISILHKIRIIKDMEDSKARVSLHIKEYVNCINKIKSHWKTALIILIITILQFTFYFTIAYFIIRGLGISSMTYLDIVSIQCMIYLMVALIPTPGTIGTSEGGFYMLFKAYLGVEIMPYATLLWSMISFYMILVVCGPVTMISSLLMNKKSSKGVNIIK